MASTAFSKGNYEVSKILQLIIGIYAYICLSSKYAAADRTKHVISLRIESM